MDLFLFHYKRSIHLKSLRMYRIHFESFWETKGAFLVEHMFYEEGDEVNSYAGKSFAKHER